MKLKLSILALSLCALCACKNDKSNTETSITKIETVKNPANYHNIEISTQLLKKGLKLNNSSIKNSPIDGINNVLSLQFIFENDFEDVIYVKVIDKTDGKAKRAKLEVKGENGRVDSFDFKFSTDVLIDAKSLILVE